MIDYIKLIKKHCNINSDINTEGKQYNYIEANIDTIINLIKDSYNEALNDFANKLDEDSNNDYHWDILQKLKL